MRSKKQFARYLQIAAFACSLGLASSASHANTIALEFVGGSPQYFPEYSVGWGFSVTGTFTVGNLGWYDESGDGFLSSHDVGIFNSGGTLLTSVTVSSADALVDRFRYAAVTPLTLVAGNYVIAGTTGLDSFQAFASSISTAPGITFTGGLYKPGSLALELPDRPSDRGLAYFAPNFSSGDPVGGGGPASVPDSGSTLCMLGVAGAALSTFSRRRK